MQERKQTGQTADKNKNPEEMKKQELENLRELCAGLPELKQTDPRSVDRDTLVDIESVEIDPELPREEKINSYLKQIRNPYCYLDHGTVVKISFLDTDVTLDERMQELARKMKR